MHSHNILPSRLALFRMANPDSVQSRVIGAYSITMLGYKYIYNGAVMIPVMLRSNTITHGNISICSDLIPRIHVVIKATIPPTRRKTPAMNPATRGNEYKIDSIDTDFSYLHTNIDVIAKVQNKNVYKK